MLHSNYILRIICLSTVLLIKASSATVYYNIPNPFGINDEHPQTYNKGYYSIKSLQCSISQSRKEVRTEVEEYFSLEMGLSYSLHRDRDSPEAGAYAIIGDGPRGRTYLVRNADQSMSQADIDCELDHAHNHRQVFPWQYVYDLPGADQDAKSKSKSKWANKGTIYGVGALWLNAIERKLASNQVGDDSPFPGSNLWHMSEGDLSIKLIFDKPEEDTSHMDLDKRRELIAKSKLNSVQISQKHSLEQDDEFGSNLATGETIDIIQVQEFRTNFGVASEPQMRRFLYQLNQCRKNTKRQRVFPSLMRALALAPERLYVLEYVATKFGQLREPADQAPKFSPEHHRFLHNEEIVSEWFSFKRETQVTVYQSLENLMPRNETGDGVEEDTTRPDEGRQQAPPSEWSQADVFTKRFTFYEEKAGVMKDGKVAHTTAHFHLVESSEGEVVSCKAAEAEAPPSWFHLLSRQVHFARKGRGFRLHGRLDGLGALLMNAAEVHYKQFGLFQREITVIYDEANLKLRTRVKADEWRLVDTNTGWSVHFYFKTLNKKHEQHQVSDLLRVDIRDTKATNERQRASDEVPERNVDSPEDESDLLIRYDVFTLMTETDEGSIDFMFSIPEECEAQARTEQTRTEDQSDEIDGDEKVEPGTEDEQYPTDDHGYDADSDKSEDGKDSQEQGEDFEFEPGNMLESFQFPDFFDYLDGKAAYTFDSVVELAPPKGSQEAAKKIYLNEAVDLENGMAKYAIYYSEERFKALQPNLEFIVNYNSELVFRVEYKHPEEITCDIEPGVDSWLRLFSTDLEYFKRDRNKEGQVLAESSNRLRLYGMGALWKAASVSEYTDYIGMKREVIEKEYGKFREVYWTLAEDGDSDFLLDFVFLYNQTQYELDMNQLNGNVELSGRRTSDLLQLKDIKAVLIPDLDDESAAAGTKFRGFSVTGSPNGVFEPSYLAPGSLGELPSSCQAALVAYSDKVGPSYSYKTNQIPTFHDFISPVNAYEAHYTVSHSIPGETRLSITTVSEFYDKDANQGRIVIGYGPESRVVFIEGSQRRMFEFSRAAGKCKRIASLRGLVDTDSGFLPDTKSEELDDRNKVMIGLAGLWNKICKVSAEKNEVLMEVRYRHEPNGNRIELRKYRFMGQVDQNNKVNFMTEMNFVARPTKVLSKSGLAVTGGQQFVLEKVDFVPRLVRSNIYSTSQLHRTTIQVSSIEVKRPLDKWDLPEECASLVPSSQDDPTGDNQPTDKPEVDGNDDMEFPKLSDLISVKNEFYMQSEITSSVPLLSNEIKMLTLDEWLYSGKMRLKSSGMKRNFDLLYYSETGEAFDISQPYKCSRQLPLFPGATQQTGAGLRELWAQSGSVVDSLSSVYYGPMSLWRLAEKNLQSVKLATETEIAPNSGKPSKLKDDSMQLETWQVTSPPGSKGKWSYKMHFYRMEQPAGDGSGVMREWHILNNIIAIEAEQPDTPGALARQVEIDVVNYRYQHEDVADMFLIPPGFGCTRSEVVEETLAENGDRLAVDLSKSYSIWFEASMTRVETDFVSSDVVAGDIEVKRQVLPTISGTLVRSYEYRNSYWIDLHAYFQKTRYLNGKQSNVKLVYDRPSGLLYRIDRASGFCEIGKQTSYMPWTLEFPAPGSDSRGEIVVIDDQMFDMLIGAPNELPLFVPLARYTTERSQVAIYEYTSTQADFKLSENLTGPVTIVRRYERALEHGSDLNPEFDVDQSGKVRNQFLHDSVNIRVMLFDPQRSRLRAEFSLVVRKALNINIEGVIQDLNVAQCYKDGDDVADRQIRTFALDYNLQVGNPDLHLSRLVPHHVFELQRQVINALVFNSNIMPLQLDGAPRIEFSHHNNQLRAIFSMMDPPTAIEYTHTRVPGSRMTVVMESQAEMYLASSLNECSKMCDKLDCLALSYCQDRTCRLLTMTDEQQREGLKSSDLTRLTGSATDPDCNYFYSVWSSIWSTGRPRTLESFYDYMDSLINLQDGKKEDYWLDVQFERVEKNKTESAVQPRYEFVEPLGFSEIRENFVAFREESTLSYADPSTKPFFKLLARDRKLETGKFVGSKDFEVKMSHSDYDHCLVNCESSSDCVLVSYCKQSSTCLWIQGRDAVKSIRETSVTADEKEGCSLIIRDHLMHYNKFIDTAEPVSYEKKLIGYSATECAAMCEAADGSEDDTKFTCLSIDHCSLLGAKDGRSDMCYLQKVHVLLESFDRSILTPKWDQGSDKQASNLSTESSRVRCNHYSKSVINDYRRVANKALVETRDSQIVRGLNQDRCAVDCHLDSECLAFEYCYDLKAKPHHSCQFIRSEHLPRELGSTNSSASVADSIESMLKKSDKCSIYVMHHMPEIYGLEKSSHFVTLLDYASQTAERHSGLFRFFIVSLFYCHIALLVGACIQFVYIRIRGWPLLFDHNY